ncbi:hypothetical protein Leryth_010282 [Lithospermum erythrorhizon]|nr:hypothetical protein Leryth_010282 [Lithospermum erythrorhizon]
MKKKRSGIKHDVPKNPLATKPSDALLDSKQGLHQRLSVETRPRFSDTHGFRSGMVNGGMGVGKADGIPQESGVRSTLSRTDCDNNMLLHDRRDYLTGSDKQMVNGINKVNAREDFRSGSPTSKTKMKAISRTARSGSGLVPKPSPVIQQSAVSDWEVSHCTNKGPAANGVNNRKRSVSARSSSPPVAQWSGQRPQKISRTARRRTNFLPIVPSSDATPPPDVAPHLDAAPYEMGSERCLLANSPQLAKLISDSFSSLSESEESRAAEIKTKEKNKNDVMDEKAGVHVQKMSTLLPPRKNKVFDGEGQGGGIRKRGRTGRTASTRSLMHLKVEKVGSALTTKQLRTSRLALNKKESKGSRLETRRLSDRKPYARQKHTTVNAAADFSVTSNDGHEELLTATIGVLSRAEALSSPFWKKMEPYFRYISDMDLAYLKHQISIRLDMSSPEPFALESNISHSVSNGFGSSEVSKIGSTTVGDELKPDHKDSSKKVQQIPLYQRLIAALVPEEGNEKVYHNGHESVFLDTCKSRFEHEVDFECGHAASNGHQSNANGWCFDELNHVMPDNSIIPISVAESKYNEADNYLCSDQQMMPEQHSSTCSEEHYNCMSINERLLLEIRSVGIFPDQVPYLELSEDDEIEKSIGSLHAKYDKLVSKKQDSLRKLLPSASEARELQEKEYESRALDKLVEMAYEKYMTCWGPNAHGMKSASGKMAKQAALAFVIQSLERYREFVQTGSSCFGVPVYKDIFISGISRLNDLQSDSVIGDDSAKLQASLNECSTEIRASVPLDVLYSPSPEYDSGKDKMSSNRVKKKQLLLDDVGGTNGTSSGFPCGIGSSFSSCSKGKRSERDRDGKGSVREVLSRQGTAKIGGSVLTDVKGERKLKTKSKQKGTQPSPSNSLMGKNTNQTNPGVLLVPKLSENARGVGKEDVELLDDPIDLSGLQIPEMGDLGVHDDFSGQGEDIGSWLNIDEDGLHDDDFMGLEIPMDDLSGLNMMI